MTNLFFPAQHDASTARDTVARVKAILMVFERCTQSDLVYRHVAHFSSLKVSTYPS